MYDKHYKLTPRVRAKSKLQQKISGSTERYSRRDLNRTSWFFYMLKSNTFYPQWNNQEFIETQNAFKEILTLI